MFRTHFITGYAVEKCFFQRYSSMLTKMKSLSKKMYYYSELAKNQKILVKRGKLYVQYHRRSQGGLWASRPPPPNRNVTNDNNVTKKPCFLRFSFF